MKWRAFADGKGPLPTFPPASSAPPPPPPETIIGGKVFPKIYSGDWYVLNIDTYTIFDEEEFRERPDAQKLRVKLSPELPKQQFEYWNRNHALLAYLIASTKVYGEKTPNGATPMAFRSEIKGAYSTTTRDDAAPLWVDKSLSDRYGRLRMKHKTTLLSEFSPEPAEIAEVEKFMRRYPVHSAEHRRLLENLERFVERRQPAGKAEYIFESPKDAFERLGNGKALVYRRTGTPRVMYVAGVDRRTRKFFDEPIPFFELQHALTAAENRAYNQQPGGFKAKNTASTKAHAAFLVSATEKHPGIALAMSSYPEQFHDHNANVSFNELLKKGGTAPLLKFK